MTCSNAGAKACPIWGDYLSSLKKWSVGLKGTCYPFESFRAHGIQVPLVAPPLPTSTQRSTLLYTQRWREEAIPYGQWPLALQCFVSFTHVPNEMHFSELEHTVPDLRPQAKDFSVWKCSSANSLSRTSVYLCLLFWLQFTSFSPLLPASVLSDFVPSLPTCSLNFYLCPCLSYRGNAALLWWSLWELIFK